MISLSPAAQRTLNELDAMDAARDPSVQIGRAMAAIDMALATQNCALAAGQCVLAAARLIRAAELLEDLPPFIQPDTTTLPPDPGARQAGGGAGSDLSSPQPAEDLPY